MSNVGAGPVAARGRGGGREGRSSLAIARRQVTIRVGLIDDHPMVIGGVQLALGSVTDLELLAHGGTTDEARQLLTRDDLDVCLLDVRLRDGNGLQVLAERGPRVHPAVLVISTFNHSQYVAAAVRYGASGFLGKGVPLADLVEAIRAVASGASVFTSEQVRKAFVTLTMKERLILELAMEGFSNKEIGARTGTSPKTVEGHLSEIFTKYGILGGRVELAMRASAEGWLDIDPPPSDVGGVGLRAGSRG